MAHRGPVRGTTCPHSPAAPHGVVNCQPNGGHRHAPRSKRSSARHPGQRLHTGANHRGWIGVTINDAVHVDNGVAACSITCLSSDFSPSGHLDMTADPRQAPAHCCTSNDMRRVTTSTADRLHQYLTEYLTARCATYYSNHMLRSPAHWDAHSCPIHVERTFTHIVMHASYRITQPIFTCIWSAVSGRMSAKIFFTTRRVAPAHIVSWVRRRTRPRVRRTVSPYMAVHIDFNMRPIADHRVSDDIRGATWMLTRYRPRRTVPRHIEPPTSHQPATRIGLHARTLTRHQTGGHTPTAALRTAPTCTSNQADVHINAQAGGWIAHLIAYGIPDRIRTQVRRRMR
jgi:hypothetical protein